MRDKLIQYQQRYPGCIHRVEHAGQQGLLTPLLREAGVHLVAHNTTAASKHDLTWGVEALATKLEAGMYTFPAKSKDNPKLQALIRGCLYYTPASHTADELMAWWIADCGAKGGGSGKGRKARERNVDM